MVGVENTQVLARELELLAFHAGGDGFCFSL